MASSTYDEETYHINAGAGSFSTRIYRSFEQYDEADSDHDQTSDCVSEQEVEIGRTMVHKHISERELELSMQRIVQHITASGKLMLHRAVVDIADLACQHPQCGLTDNGLYGGQLYLLLEPTQWTAPQSREVAATATATKLPTQRISYHLTCLEMLYEHSTSLGQLVSGGLQKLCTTTGISEKNEISKKTLMKMYADDTKHASHTAASEESYHALQGVRVPPSMQHTPSMSRVGSTINNFQLVASSIELGGNLSNKQEAAVNLWRYASKVQLSLQKQRADDNCGLYQDATGLRCCANIHAAQLASNLIVNGQLEKWQSLTKLNSEHCYCRSLSEVLDLMCWS